MTLTTCRILVPLDGSAAAEAALIEVERTAVDAAEVHLLHVVPSFPSTLGSSSAGVMEIHDKAYAYLKDVRGRFPSLGGIDLIRTGAPADAVFQVALEFNIDLIAMCTHARTGLGKWFMGSVAETVVRQTQLPVLLTRPGIPPPRTALRRILVALDGSEESSTIMIAVRRLAVRTGAEVIVLHVTGRSFAPVPQRGILVASGNPEDPEQKLLTVASWLEEFDLASRQVIAEGDPVEEILGHAKSLDADLIAMSTHARRGRERAIFGSVTQAVLGRTDRPVLLQRPLVRTIAPEARGPRQQRGGGGLIRADARPEGDSMNTTLSRSKNGDLSDALAGLMDHLRGNRGACSRGTPDEALSGDADRFVGRLSGHLRYAEETLFPALEKIEPGSACNLEELKKDHRLFHLYARDLGLQIRGGDKEKAYGLARSFLAVMLDHLHRESKVVDRFVRSLDVVDARRLSGALAERLPAGASSGLQDSPR